MVCGGERARRDKRNSDRRNLGNFIDIGKIKRCLSTPLPLILDQKEKRFRVAAAVFASKGTGRLNIQANHRRSSFLLDGLSSN